MIDKMCVRISKTNLFHSMKENGNMNTVGSDGCFKCDFKNINGRELAY